MLLSVYIEAPSMCTKKCHFHVTIFLLFRSVQVWLKLCLATFAGPGKYISIYWGIDPPRVSCLFARYMLVPIKGTEDNFAFKKKKITLWNDKVYLLS